MPEQDDRSYLSKPLIPDTEFIIEDNKVKISCPSTLYAHVVLRPPIIKKEVLALYKRVLALAKEKKVSISYREHIHKTIRERWEEYVVASASMKALFAQIITQSRVVKERGLHYGTRDDVELEKLQRLCHQYENFYHGGSVVSLISSIQSLLEILMEDLTATDSQWKQIFV